MISSNTATPHFAEWFFCAIPYPDGIVYGRSDANDLCVEAAIVRAAS